MEQKNEKKKKNRQSKKEARKMKKELKKAEREKIKQEKAMMAISGTKKVKEDSLKQKFLKSSLFDHLWILNPHNLAKEVHVYGYNFSWKSHLFLMICCILGISTISFLFQLNTVYFICSIIAVIIAIPNGVRYMYRQMYEQKRFADVTTYMEQMLYSFEKSNKILSSLEETKEIFESGSMRSCIDKAIEYIKKGKSKGEDGLLREALAFIEERYPCIKLTTVHELFINSEEQGGDCEDAIALLLNDISEWKKRGYELQANKKMLNVENVASIVVATILCYVTLFVLDKMDEIFPNTSVNVNIFKVTPIQLSSVIFIGIMILTYLKSTKKMTSNWLQSEDVVDEKMILSSYKTIEEYNEKKQQKRSVIFSIPFIAGSIVAMIYQKEFVAVGCMILAIFMLQQHNIGYKLAISDVNKALYQALPQWFMQLALLLQHHNVQVSLARSMEDAPTVIKPELEKLMTRLAEKPSDLKSYTDFFKNFDVPEAQSCMKMLHAISETGVGDVQTQISNIIDRVNDMQDVADQARNENVKYSMKKIFLYPVLSATVKLLVDMTIGMLFMFQLLGSMGGY